VIAAILNFRLKVMVCGITMSVINAEIRQNLLKYGIKIYLKYKIMLNKEELSQELEEFLNQSGQWLAFKSFIEAKGYALSEFGIEDE
jgi:hypothetical protein